MAPNLPDEILIKIIEEYIEPFSIRVNQGSECLENRGVATSYEPLYVGFPTVMNTLRVNKKIHEETMTIVRRRFNGKLTVNAYCIEGLIDSLRAGTWLPDWLKARVNLLSIIDFGVFSWDLWDLNPLLAANCFVNLNHVVLTRSGSTFDPFLGSIAGVMYGFRDQYLIHEYQDSLKNEAKIMGVIRARKLRLTYNAFYDEGHRGYDAAALVFEINFNEVGNEQCYVRERWAIHRSHVGEFVELFANSQEVPVKVDIDAKGVLKWIKIYRKGQEQKEA